MFCSELNDTIWEFKDILDYLSATTAKELYILFEIILLFFDIPYPSYYTILVIYSFYSPAPIAIRFPKVPNL